MQYENIPTVRLQIIAGILGLIAAELLADRAAAFKSALARHETVVRAPAVGFNS